MHRVSQARLQYTGDGDQDDYVDTATEKGTEDEKEGVTAAGEASFEKRAAELCPAVKKCAVGPPAIEKCIVELPPAVRKCVVELPPAAVEKCAAGPPAGEVSSGEWIPTDDEIARFYLKI